MLPGAGGTAASSPRHLGWANSTWEGRDVRMWIQEAPPAPPHIEMLMGSPPSPSPRCTRANRD